MQDHSKSLHLARLEIELRYETLTTGAFGKSAKPIHGCKAWPAVVKFIKAGLRRYAYISGVVLLLASMYRGYASKVGILVSSTHINSWRGHYTAKGLLTL